MGAVLCDRDIIEMNKKGLLVTTPLSKDQIQPNSIDLTLANSWKMQYPNDINVHYPVNKILYKEGRMVTHKFVYTDIINPLKPMRHVSGNFGKFDVDGVEREAYILAPGQFILFASNETINIPNGILGFAIGRSSIARMAIQVEQAGLFDAGFNGTATLEIQNQSEFAIMLLAGMRIAQMWFVYANEADVVYGADKGSKYNGQIEATESRIHEDFISDNQQYPGSFNVQNLKNRRKNLD